MSEVFPEDEVEVVTQSGDPYNTSGKTVLATQAKQAFRPSNEDLPIITPAGVRMTKAQAEEVLAEVPVSDEGLVFIKEGE